MKSTRSVVCNHGNAVNVIHRRWYVIKPKKYIQGIRLDAIQFAKRTDYIPLTRITYQVFGLDATKTKKQMHSHLLFLFWLRGRDLNHMTSGLWARRATRLLYPAIYKLSTIGAGNRARTGTGYYSHWILSPGRLPIPPFRHLCNCLNIITHFSFFVNTFWKYFYASIICRGYLLYTKHYHMLSIWCGKGRIIEKCLFSIAFSFSMCYYVKE